MSPQPSPSSALALVAETPDEKEISTPLIEVVCKINELKRSQCPREVFVITVPVQDRYYPVVVTFFIQRILQL